MNYKIINDELALKKFIEWLPELKDDESYFCLLLSRNKYKPIKDGKKQCQIKKFTCHKKELLFQKIQQLEVKVGTYKNNGLDVEQNSLVLYIHPNPRNLIKATESSVNILSKYLKQSYFGYNPHKVVLKEIQKSCSRTIFKDFDFDNVDIEVTKLKLDSILNRDSYTIVKTKNGFHLLVEEEKISEEFKKNYYPKLSTLEGCDIKGDNLLPVIGCCQGDFTPYFY